MPIISGVVYDSSNAAAGGRVVRAYRRDTGALLGETVTGDGSSTTFASQVAADSPALWYRMAETSGTTAANSGTATSSDGTYSGGCTLNQTGFVSGGKSVLFGGSASPGRIISANTASFSSACTLMAYIEPAASGQATNDIAYIVSKDENNASGTSKFPISLVWRAATTKLEFRLSKGNDFSPDAILASGTLTPSTSYLVHAVYRANGLCELYVNGSLVDSTTINFTISDSGSIPWTVGCCTPFSIPASQIAFNGRIGEAAVFSSALSSARIDKHFMPLSGALGAYAIGTGSFTGECNVIALDDSAGSVENDLIIRTTGV